MAFMNARKRNKMLTYIIVAFVSVGLLLSVSLYWSGGTGTGTSNTYSNGTASALEAAAVQDFAAGDQLKQQGKIKEANEKFAQAISKFEQVLKSDPNNIQVLGDLATAYFYSGKTDKAVETARKALQIEPKYTTVRVNLAIFLSDQNKTSEAINELKQVPKGDSMYDKAQELLQQLNTNGNLVPQGGGAPPQNMPPQNNTQTSPQSGAPGNNPPPLQGSSQLQGNTP